jgi:hypothetical protein
MLLKEFSLHIYLNQTINDAWKTAQVVSKQLCESQRWNPNYSIVYNGHIDSVNKSDTVEHIFRVYGEYL